MICEATARCMPDLKKHFTMFVRVSATRDRSRLQVSPPVALCCAHKYLQIHDEIESFTIIYLRLVQRASRLLSLLPSHHTVLAARRGSKRLQTVAHTGIWRWVTQRDTTGIRIYTSLGNHVRGYQIIVNICPTGLNSGQQPKLRASVAPEFEPSRCSFFSSRLSSGR